MRPIDADKLEAKCKVIIAQEREYGTATVSWAHAYESFLDLLETSPTIDTQRWILASEPPKESGEYIVMIGGASNATTLLYSELGDWFEEVDGYPEYYHVTHWMPLPEGPKEGE